MAAAGRAPVPHQLRVDRRAHSGYSFGTLDNLDTAIAHRYGQWNSLAQYVQEAQVQNYEDTRAQFEAYIDHWNNYPTPSTGTVYWQLNKGWPTMLWDLYNYDYDEAGAYFGAKKANEDLHVLYAYDTGTVTIDNLTGAASPACRSSPGLRPRRPGARQPDRAACRWRRRASERRAHPAGARRHHAARAG